VRFRENEIPAEKFDSFAILIGGTGFDCHRRGEGHVVNRGRAASRVVHGREVIRHVDNGGPLGLKNISICTRPRGLKH
jgi:hypothetical protein